MSYELISLYKNISQEDDQDRSTSTCPTRIVSPNTAPNDRGVSIAGWGVIPEAFSSSAPSHFGEGEITVMVVDPFTLYCYWALNQAVAAKYMLTICNISENVSWEIPIDNPMGSMYVKIGGTRPAGATCPAGGMTLAHGPSYFQVAVGINFQANEMTPAETTRPAKTFSPIALSNRVSVPPSAASNRLDQEWWSPQDATPLLARERYGVVTVSSEIASHLLLGKERAASGVPSLFCISRK